MFHKEREEGKLNIRKIVEISVPMVLILDTNLILNDALLSTVTNGQVSCTTQFSCPLWRIVHNIRQRAPYLEFIQGIYGRLPKELLQV